VQTIDQIIDQIWKDEELGRYGKNKQKNPSELLRVQLLKIGSSPPKMVLSCLAPQPSSIKNKLELLSNHGW